MLYDVITADSIPALKSLVQGRISEDWIPCGGMVSYRVFSGMGVMPELCFAQALIKYGQSHQHSPSREDQLREILNRNPNES